MSNWVRRIRGAIGMGLTWAVAWFGAGMVLLAIVGLDAADVPFPLLFGLLGYFAGATFSGVLALMEGRRRFDDMSFGRFAAWGALGGFLLCAVFVMIVGLAGAATLSLLGLAPVFALASAASAVGSLGLARITSARTMASAGRRPRSGFGLISRPEAMQPGGDLLDPITSFRPPQEQGTRGLQ